MPLSAALGCTSQLEDADFLQLSIFNVSRSEADPLSFGVTFLLLLGRKFYPPS